ncbi:uncharacterized protein DS421_12g360590 [Arachis hypogaea]|nr:uncharacterized protein DS421_12g360590 [Arachis hypogaea]
MQPIHFLLRLKPSNRSHLQHDNCLRKKDIIESKEKVVLHTTVISLIKINGKN